MISKIFKTVENVDPGAPRTRQTAATDVLICSKCLWLAFGASEVLLVRRFPLFSTFEIIEAKMAPRRPKDGSKTRQDAFETLPKPSKTRQDDPKTHVRRRQDVPKSLQDAPGRPKARQDTPRRSYDRPKSLQDAPRSNQDILRRPRTPPKAAPRRSEGAPRRSKTSPRCIKTSPRPPPRRAKTSQVVLGSVPGSKSSSKTVQRVAWKLLDAYKLSFGRKMEHRDFQKSFISSNALQSFLGGLSASSRRLQDAPKTIQIASRRFQDALLALQDPHIYNHGEPSAASERA